LIHIDEAAGGAALGGCDRHMLNVQQGSCILLDVLYISR
jgi:hypothetical protein